MEGGKAKAKVNESEVAAVVHQSMNKRVNSKDSKRFLEQRQAEREQFIIRFSPNQVFKAENYGVVMLKNRNFCLKLKFKV